jgi:outer membrane translocation and assembly module TamA
VDRAPEDRARRTRARENAVDVEIIGAGAVDKSLQVVAETTLKTGTRLDHASYEALKASMMRTARDRGFLDATLTRRELIVNPTDLTADARLTLETAVATNSVPWNDQDVINDDLMRAFALLAGPAVLPRH